ncbi:MAG: hypothetical protein CEN90_617 [Parcubacteria group bacterium Licking1014_17]|nr:MAG: hypothetical protein CEN90_617 [Parcubacteria group bacterium Licking1014_17]
MKIPPKDMIIEKVEIEKKPDGMSRTTTTFREKTMEDEKEINIKEAQGEVGTLERIEATLNPYWPARLRDIAEKFNVSVSMTLPVYEDNGRFFVSDPNAEDAVSGNLLEVRVKDKNEKVIFVYQRGTEKWVLGYQQKVHHG